MSADSFMREQMRRQIAQGWARPLAVPSRWVEDVFDRTRREATDAPLDMVCIGGVWMSSNDAAAR